MMRGLWLGIEAATPVGSVAVARDGVLIAEVVLGVQSRHSSSLLPAVDYVLREAGGGPRDLAGVAVGGGPGSFTGVRVAAATAKALVRTLEVPLLAISSLATLAAAAAGPRPVCALFDARRHEVYAACYDFTGDEIRTLAEPAACSIGEALATARAHGAVLVGDGALRHRAAVDAAGGELAGIGTAVPRASALLHMANRNPAAHVVDDVGTWEPLYLRESGAVRGVSA